METKSKLTLLVNSSAALAMAIFAVLMELFDLTEMLNPIFEKVGEAIFDSVTSVWSALTDLLNVESELDKLRRTVARIHALLKDAEESRVIRESSVLLWLAGLRDVAMDAEDLIDEFQTYLNSQKAAAATGGASSSRKRKRQWLSLRRPAWLRRWKISGKIKEIQEIYGEIADARERLHLRESDGPRRQDDVEEKLPRAQASRTANSLILGMNDKKNQILELLKKEESMVTGAEGVGGSTASIIAGTGTTDAPQSGTGSSSGLSSGTRSICAPGAESISPQNTVVGSNDTLGMETIATVPTTAPIIAIVGAGGIGKTTLARLVFDDPEVEHYCKFDVHGITKERIESIKISSCETLSSNLLQKQLQQLIYVKKFLLMLDGVWNEARI